MAGRVVRWVWAVGLAALWWWAVLRLALLPDAGALEGSVAAGGWGLSLLPVHCVPKERAAGVARWRRSSPGRDGAGRVTRASRRRRWGGGSGRS
ncbi:hypothetical protein RB200_25125 [Streptomyces sp. PmtG]